MRHDPWQERLDYTQSPDPGYEEDFNLLSMYEKVSVQLQITTKSAAEQIGRLARAFQSESSWNPTSQAQGLMQPLPACTSYTVDMSMGDHLGYTPESAIWDEIYTDPVTEQISQTVNRYLLDKNKKYPTSIDMSRRRRPKRSGKDPGKR